MSVSFLDIFFLVIVLASTVISTFRGFSKCVLSKVAFIASILAAVSFTPAAEQIISNWLDVKYLTTILSFVACFIIAFVILKLLQILIEKICKGRILKSLDRIFGAVWGLAIGLLLSVACLLILVLIPVDAVVDLISKSFFAKFVLPFFSEFQGIKIGDLNV